MGASFDDIVRESKEESGCTRGGARFRQEKRNKTEEGISTIEMQDHEGKAHGTK